NVSQPIQSIAGSTREGTATTRLRRSDKGQRSETQPGAVGTGLELQAAAFRAFVEAAVTSVVLVSVNGSEEIVRPLRIIRPIGELGPVSVLSQVPIECAWYKVVQEQGGDSGTSDPDLAPIVTGGPHDGLSRDLGLVDGGNRLRLIGQPRLYPAELRRRSEERR